MRKQIILFDLAIMRTYVNEINHVITAMVLISLLSILRRKRNKTNKAKHSKISCYKKFLMIRSVKPYNIRNKYEYEEKQILATRRQTFSFIR